MEIHQLRYFVAVANLKNFTRAAEACLVSQPSLSQQIMKLEAEFGQQLVERLGKGIRLTAAGDVLYQRAQTILAEVEGAKAELQERTNPGHGAVAIGAIVTLAPYVLPPLLKSFSRTFPHAEATVYEGLTQQIVEGCRRGDLNLGIVALPIDDDQLHIEPLFSDELLLAVHRSHRLAAKQRVTADDLMKENFILLDPIHCLGEQIVAFCDRQACRPKIICRSSQILTVQELVGVNHGVSLLPASAAKVDKSKTRVYRSLSGTRPERVVGMIWNRRRVQSTLTKALIKELSVTLCKK